MAEGTVKRANVLKEVLFEVSYDLDKFEAALFRLANAVGETKVEIVKLSANLYDYAELTSKLAWYAEHLEKLAKECRALINLIHTKLDLERRERLKRRPALRLVLYALKKGYRTPTAVRQYLEGEGVYVSEVTVKARLRELVEMGLVVREEGGYYFPIEDFIAGGERG